MTRNCKTAQIVITLSMLLVGCTHLPVQIKATNGILLTNMPTTTPMLTIVPTPNKTVTSDITSHTMITPKPTPSTTISIIEAVQTVNELLKYNGNCQFPCYWGLIPGKSYWDTSKSFITKFAFEIGKGWVSDKIINYDAYFPLDQNPSLMNSLSVIFSVDRETKKIKMITTNQKYSLLWMIETFGVPEEIWLYVTAIPGTGPAAYEINLFYKASGVIAGISGSAKVNGNNTNGDKVIICPTTMILDARGLHLISPDIKIRYADVVAELSTTNRSVLLENVSMLSDSDFINLILLGDPSNCLNIPMKDGDMVIKR